MGKCKLRNILSSGLNMYLKTYSRENCVSGVLACLLTWCVILNTEFSQKIRGSDKNFEGSLSSLFFMRLQNYRFARREKLKNVNQRTQKTLELKFKMNLCQISSSAIVLAYWSIWQLTKDQLISQCVSEKNILLTDETISKLFGMVQKSKDGKMPNWCKTWRRFAHVLGMFFCIFYRRS